MKLVYLGTPEMAVPPLRALVDAGHDVVRVITRIDKKRGRGGALSPSPVKAAALELGLTVSHDPDDVLAAVTDDGAELGVVVAYGRIIKPHLLDVLPMVNLHFSLLPRWRGAAPVERALLAGDAETGVDVMRVEEGLDTGGIYAERRVPIGDDTTADELRRTLVDVGADLLVEQLATPVTDWIDDPTPQRGEPLYASKLTKDEFEIDWSQSMIDVHRRIRVGGAWTTFRGKRLKIHAADLVDGSILPTVVQPEGKGPMAFDAWRNGAQPTADERFGGL
ncbi:methionyl-tRNA formyltransferase [Ilumatobacter coccineus]|uniref:Methionyl-tRNA formyltransferase n=1 Tax=Ilumatobacter coccineus (strain NBRC 103263 / KCTC 29153 / YM16-304) TaxID=1313172 RepID=A0A6C7E7B5_ILUCY|nr:methionyl-tRNA formyltransferase [Ilumatobacter coccineus]BAN02371.1 methionyl-tRNA formyltransferase [Ilumatobacter coccineus YM16-304]